MCKVVNILSKKWNAHPEAISSLHGFMATIPKRYTYFISATNKVPSNGDMRAME